MFYFRVEPSEFIGIFEQIETDQEKIAWIRKTFFGLMAKNPSTDYAKKLWEEAENYKAIRSEAGKKGVEAKRKNAEIELKQAELKLSSSLPQANNSNSNRINNSNNNNNNTEIKKEIKEKKEKLFLSLAEAKLFFQNSDLDIDYLPLLGEWLERCYDKRFKATTRTLKTAYDTLVGLDKETALNSLERSLAWRKIYVCKKDDIKAGSGGYKTKSDEINDKWKKIAEERQEAEKLGKIENIFDFSNFKQIGR